METDVFSEEMREVFAQGRVRISGNSIEIDLV